MEPVRVSIKKIPLFFLLFLGIYCIIAESERLILHFFPDWFFRQEATYAYRKLKDRGHQLISGMQFSTVCQNLSELFMKHAYPICNSQECVCSIVAPDGKKLEFYFKFVSQSPYHKKVLLNMEEIQKFSSMLIFTKMEVIIPDMIGKMDSREMPPMQ